ncbi:flagellar brake protein [Spirochaeta lutea]|uniref:flagellar brake protein n=1 Tax=Spirochaeta lutea TaxID=1480694 RepID=UPI00056B5A32|nr:flagellar brake protein [Spirochaeta lutea]
MTIVLIILGSVILLFSLVVIRGGGFGFPWLSFYVKGAESGFSFRELNLLRVIAVHNKLPNPTSLFWSEKALDRCIRGTILDYQRRGRADTPESVEFIGKLFEFRKRVEFNLPKYRLGLSSTRSIPAGQQLKIALPGSGIYSSKVVENIRKYIAISYPTGKRHDPLFSWRGQSVKIYFWRKDDAGYYFETKVLGDYSDRQYPILHILHSENLIRAQKRGSIRVGLQQSGSLYPLKSLGAANESPVTSGGYRCKMVDISESGAGVMVGGRAKAGMVVKLQTTLGGQDIVMCGTVKGVTYKETQNLSILHIEAVSPSQAMKNRILIYVYGILGQGDSNAGAKGNASAQTSAPQA